MAKTPNLDKLAARGTTFLNAHCNSPLCNPSRTSLMLGLRPTTTGVYGLTPWFRTLPEFKDRVSLPQHFAATATAPRPPARSITGHRRPRQGHRGNRARVPNHRALGRRRHQATAKNSSRPRPWATIRSWIGASGRSTTTTPARATTRSPAGPSGRSRTPPKDQPFFIAAGFFLPHVPCYATQKWFDLYPDDDSVLPKILEADREDTRASPGTSTGTARAAPEVAQGKPPVAQPRPQLPRLHQLRRCADRPPARRAR
jgi:choline-sulfatase